MTLTYGWLVDEKKDISIEEMVIVNTYLNCSRQEPQKSNRIASIGPSLKALKIVKK